MTQQTQPLVWIQQRKQENERSKHLDLLLDVVTFIVIVGGISLMTFLAAMMTRPA